MVGGWWRWWVLVMVVGSDLVGVRCGWRLAAVVSWVLCCFFFNVNLMYFNVLLLLYGKIEHLIYAVMLYVTLK